MKSLLVAALLVAATCGSAFHLPKSTTGGLYVFMCADDGTYSGENELGPLARLILDPQNVTIPGCGAAQVGTYAYGAQTAAVLVVTTGIGETRAALCTQRVMSTVEVEPAAVLFVGTSGWSPFVGGLDPTVAGGCSPQQSLQQIVLGSVCVTPTAYDGGCEFLYEGNDVDPKYGACMLRNISAANAPALFGECVGYSAMGASIADTIANVIAPQVPLPNVPAELAAYDADFWAAMQLGGGAAPAGRPQVLRHCAEADGHTIWVGPRHDIECRMRASMAEGVAPGPVPCVSAMEGFGFLMAMKAVPQIPATIIRGASNYDMFPLAVDTSSGGAFWSQNMQYTSPAAWEAYHKLGYLHAIHTTNVIAIAFLQYALSSN